MTDNEIIEKFGPSWPGASPVNLIPFVRQVEREIKREFDQTQADKQSNR